MFMFYASKLWSSRSLTDDPRLNMIEKYANARDFDFHNNMVNLMNDLTKGKIIMVYA